MNLKSVLFIGLFLALVGCVPLKKYQELESNYARCQEDQAKYKTEAIDFGSRLKEMEVQVGLMKSDLTTLRDDTARVMDEYRAIEVELKKTKDMNNVLETKYASVLSAGSRERAALINELEDTRVQLQKKEDRLSDLEKELVSREKVLIKKEARIQELESIIQKKDDASKALKLKIAAALTGFKDRGISVVERNGKIYVSVEAQLLFPSGKTDVNIDGKKALIDLAVVLESQKDIDIIVEGHTDVDPLKSAAHPKDNWELSVLRATSVVKIMLENSKMDALHISAAGRSEYHPVDINDKAKNRRIEIIITPDLTELFELISSE
ncbi:OmpA/MotB family protein [Crocinitomix catalasitica]|uniref:OmpA/MotB family protein n=1 Tax=Crocinitomix catalasitica TaxID=184607 RepID=UPI000688A4C3|nr:OmpA family protein [Crocinitomix catalasitica]